MDVKVVYVKELSQNIKILKYSKQEIEKELNNFPKDISEDLYKSLVLEVFVPSIGIVFDNLLAKVTTLDSNYITDIRDLIYSKVLLLNSYLDPTKLYLSSTNAITLTKQPIKLITTESWKKKEDPLSLALASFYDQLEFSDEISSIDHTIEVETWELFNIIVKIRVFREQSKQDILFGLKPTSEDELKYYIVLAGIDSFSHIYKYLTETPGIDRVPMHKIVYSLYDLVIKYNPFLKVTIAEVANINNKLSKTIQENGNEKQKDLQLGMKAVQDSLKSVPKKDILNLEQNILENIFGQNSTVHDICSAIKRAFIGLKLKNRPIGAFLFYGPTSSGKTELAKVLARYLIKSETSGFIKIGCNSLQMDHTIHTLIGSPPSYVGYEDRGLLYKGFKKGIFKVLLFDEIDKATPKLFDLLLEALEEGQLLLADGSVVDLSETIIILTSNIGQQEVNESLNVAGFESKHAHDSELAEAIRSQYEKVLLEALKPEFIARLNGIYFFKELTEKDLIRVIKLNLNRYLACFNKKVTLTVGDGVYTYILKQCRKKYDYTPRIHARNIRDYIDTEVIQKLGDFFLSSEKNITDVSELILSIENKTLTFKIN